MRYSFDDAAAPEHANHAVLRDPRQPGDLPRGWIASCFHGRVPWIRSAALAVRRRRRDAGSCTTSPTTSARASISTAEYPGQAPRAAGDLRPRGPHVRRLSAQRPDRRCERCRTTGRAISRARPTSRSTARTCACPSWPRVNVKNTSFDLRGAASRIAGRRRRGRDHLPGRLDGRLVAVREGRASRPTPTTTSGARSPRSSATSRCPPATSTLGLSFDYDGGGLGKGGLARCSSTAPRSPSGRVERTVPFVFSMSGETLDVGVDTGLPSARTRTTSRSRARSTGSTSTCGPSSTDAQHRQIQDGQLRAARAMTPPSERWWCDVQPVEFPGAADHRERARSDSDHHHDFCFDRRPERGLRSHGWPA